MPLQFINWKARNMGTYRNISNAWLREIRSDNYIWINSIDANRRGLKTGDTVNIFIKDIAMECTVSITEGIAPGVVGAAYNMGETCYVVTRTIVDGQKLKHYQLYN